MFEAGLAYERNIDGLLSHLRGESSAVRFLKGLVKSDGGEGVVGLVLDYLGKL